MTTGGRGVVLVRCQLDACVAAEVKADPRFVTEQDFDAGSDPADVTGVIVRSETTVDRSFLYRFPALRFVVRAGSGLDRLDVEELERRAIALVRNPHITSVAVAEYAGLALLALARRVPLGSQAMASGIWAKSACIGEPVGALRVVIWGGGAVGRALHDHFLQQGVSDRFVDWPSLPPQLPRVGAEKALAEADAHVLCVPLRETTRRLFDRQVLARVAKRRPYIVNVARVEVLDLDAAVEALDRGDLRGLAVDPIDSATAGYVLRERPRNLLLTPHVGAQRDDVILGAGRWAVREALHLLNAPATDNDR